MKQEVIRTGNSLRPAERQSFWPHVLMFAFGAGWSFSIQLGGAIFGAELVALLCLPFIRAPQVVGRYPLLRSVLLAYGLILIGLVVADIANETKFDLAIKGWANAIFAAGSLVFVVALLDKNHRAILSYFIGVAIFSFLFGAESFAVGGREGSMELEDILYDSNNFKIRALPFILPLSVMMVYFVHRRSYVLGTFAAFCCSIIFILADARSAGLNFFIVSLIIMFVRPGRRMQKRQFMALAIAGTMIGYLGYTLYVSNANLEDRRGHNAGQLARIENPYNPIELLGVGRSEWLTAPEAVLVSPILGNGSWAYDVSGRFTHLRALRANDVRNYFFSYRRQLNLIPTHSVLLACWIWAGLIGLFGAGLLALAIGRAILGGIKAKSEWLVISAFCAASLVWDFLFSPFQTIRLSFPFALGFLIVIMTVRSRRRTSGMPAILQR